MVHFSRPVCVRLVPEPSVIFERAKVLYGVHFVIAVWIDQFQSYQA
jgi:hypothetical protein